MAGKVAAGSTLLKKKHTKIILELAPFPRLPPCTQVTENWAGPGSEVT